MPDCSIPPRFRPSRRVWQLAALAALAFTMPARPACAQRAKKEICTVCLNDEELMKSTGVSHGNFKFARTDSETIEKEFFWHPVWIETKHFRLGVDLDTWKIPESERKAYRAELTELAERFPRISPRKATMDKWLRAHLLAERCEKLHQEFLGLMGRKDEEFWDEEKNYLRGVGPYLGESDKYEVMIFQQRAPFREFMSTTWGLTYVKPQRWNNVDRFVLWFGFNLEEEHVRHDQHVHNFVRHNLAHNLLDGYEYYGYDLPVWITEGFAHWIERENDERYNMFDTVEGSFTAGRSLERWEPEVRKIAGKDEAASFASLLRRKSFAELNFEDHLVIWSKIDFLIRYDREKFARFINALKGRRKPDGTPDGANLDDAQRDAFRDIYGWTLLHAEQEWQAWVQANYAVK